MMQGTNVEQDEMTCCIQEWQLWRDRGGGGGGAGGALVIIFIYFYFFFFSKKTFLVLTLLAAIIGESALFSYFLIQSKNDQYNLALQ